MNYGRHNNFFKSFPNVSRCIQYITSYLLGYKLPLHGEIEMVIIISQGRQEEYLSFFPHMSWPSRLVPQFLTIPIT